MTNPFTKRETEVPNELKDLVARALLNELDVVVSGVDINRTFNDDGDQVIEVEVKIVVTPQKWKRGSMFDLVSTTARILREYGEVGIPYIVAKMNEGAQARAI